MADLATLIADLSARVQRLEDEREIIRVLTSYGLAVDMGDADLCAGLYTDDTVIELGPTSQFTGTAGARQLVLDERHQEIVGRCAHTMGPFVVDVAIDGDHATATGYVRVYVSDPDMGNPRLWRIGYTTFELRRVATTWQIAKRLSRSLGGQGGAELFRVGFERRQHADERSATRSEASTVPCLVVEP
jgi:ketosteroid isomerase-like protein